MCFRHESSRYCVCTLKLSGEHFVFLFAILNPACQRSSWVGVGATESFLLEALESQTDASQVGEDNVSRLESCCALT